MILIRAIISTSIFALIFMFETLKSWNNTCEKCEKRQKINFLEIVIDVLWTMFVFLAGCEFLKNYIIY